MHCLFIFVQAADRSAHHKCIRNIDNEITCVDRAEIDQRRLIQHAVFRHQHRIDRIHDVSGRYQRVDSLVRRVGTGVLAVDRDMEIVTGSAHRPRYDANRSHRQLRPHVRRENRIRTRISQCPVFDHRRCAAVLLVRLEQEDNRARQFFPVRRQHLCRRHLDRRIRVMSAGMHHARIL